MDIVQIERTKLLANALNAACSLCFTVGIATPVARYVYNVSGFSAVIEVPSLGFGILGWIGAMLGLHLLARRVLRGLS